MQLVNKILLHAVGLDIGMALGNLIFGFFSARGIHIEQTKVFFCVFKLPFQKKKSSMIIGCEFCPLEPKIFYGDTRSADSNQVLVLQSVKKC